MDFTPAHARAQAERELRWRENWACLSPWAKRVWMLRLLFWLFVTTAVVAAQRIGVPWIFPVYVGIVLLLVTSRLAWRRGKA